MDTDDTQIPLDELRFETSRSSGPGGQNVNKVNTRVTLLWDLERSAAVDEEQKQLLRERLAGRISKAGVLRVSSQRHRTQAANREAALARFRQLLEQALESDPARVQTKPSREARERRLEEKKHRAEVKRSRAKILPED